MRNLLEAIDPKGDNILCLLDDEGNSLWKLWVTPHLTNGTKKPGTIISYLTLYEKFLNFVTHERFNKTASAVHPDYMVRLTTLQKDIKAGVQLWKARPTTSKTNAWWTKPRGFSLCKS